jgi:hypothetical protein
MAKPKIWASWQGVISKDLLSISQTGIIIGVTSRGIFLQLDTGWILFLSCENFRGPLTLNLAGDASILQGLENKSQVFIRDGKICVMSGEIVVDCSQASIWIGQLPPDAPLSPERRCRVLKSAAYNILAQKREPGLYRFLAELLKLEFEHSPAELGPFSGLDAGRLLLLLKEGDPDSILSALTPMLGLGAGLTPAGDDLILGMLLAYNRWKPVLMPRFGLAELNDRIIQVASQRTTRLSANLISCAVQGQADERLVHALDGIMTGTSGEDQCVRNLLAWGDSSGSNALAGMALAILASQN